ncbi:MAG: hemin uptake protein HemP [Pseudomonadota bacterium]
MQTETSPAPTAVPPAPVPAVPAVRRLSSASLMQAQREVEIEHGGKIYRLRITQLNKLILTA